MNGCATVIQNSFAAVNVWLKMQRTQRFKINVPVKMSNAYF